MSEAKSFVVYDDIVEILDALTDEEVGQLFRGMVKYHMTGEEPDFSGALKLAFIPVRQGINRNAEKYAMRCERMRENANKRWSNNANACNSMQTHANDANSNTNTNTDSKSKSNSESVDVWSLSHSVLSYLNSKAGTNHKTDDAHSVHLISDLAHAGFTETDLKHVIDVKVADWRGDPKVEQYLRPSTLFGAKFEQYLAQPKPPEIIRAEKKQERSERDKERAKALQSELTIVKDNITEADTATRIRLKEREAWLEDEIKRLTS